MVIPQCPTDIARLMDNAVDNDVISNNAVKDDVRSVRQRSRFVPKFCSFAADKRLIAEQRENPIES